MVPSIGSKINNWKVIGYVEDAKKGITALKIQCRCGKERTVKLNILQNLGLECKSCHMKRYHGTLDFKD